MQTREIPQGPCTQARKKAPHSPKKTGERAPSTGLSETTLPISQTAHACTKVRSSPLSTNCQIIAARGSELHIKDVMTQSSGRTPVGQSNDGPKPPSTAEGAHHAHNSIRAPLANTRPPGRSDAPRRRILKRALMEALFLRQSRLSKSSTKSNKD